MDGDEPLSDAPSRQHPDGTAHAVARFVQNCQKRHVVDVACAHDAAGPRLRRRLDAFVIPSASTVSMFASSPPIDGDPGTVNVPREFHRRMAGIIDAVQAGIWTAGVHDLLGYATDYAFGDKRGLQTLVLKSSRRSAYVRLQWETIMSDSPADRQLVATAIQNAIQELS